MEYGIQKYLDLKFEEALERVADALKAEGFGVLTRIDIHEKLKEKLGVDFKKYVILGACHPPSAHKALLAEEGYTGPEKRRIHVGQFIHTPFFNIHEIQGLIRQAKGQSPGSP